MFLTPKKKIRGRPEIFYFLMEEGLYDPYNVRDFREGENYVSYVIDINDGHEELHVMAFIEDDELTDIGVNIFPNMLEIKAGWVKSDIIYYLSITVIVLTLLSAISPLILQHLKI